MNNKDLILLDLFSGMGGFHLGLEYAGFNFRKAYFSEIDKHAIANYKYNFKNAEYIGSVESILTSGIERPNIITFGSPCQDFSLAGKRKGLDGDRSSLIEYALSAVSHFRPDIFIWENVKGTFSSNGGRDFIAILQAIADIGLYECEWQLVNTSWLLPQNRERIYLVGHLATSFRDWRGVFPITEDDFFIREENQSNRNGIQAENCTTINAGFGNKQSDTYIRCKDIAGCLTGGGLHSDMDVVIHQRGRGKLKDNLNEVCPTISSSAFEQNNTVIQVNQSKESGGRQPYQHNRVYDDKGICPALNTDARSPGVFLSEAKHKHGEERIYTDIAPTIQARYGPGGDNIPYVNNARRLTEKECERLQGFPDDWTRLGDYLSEKVQKYIFGNNKRWRTKKATLSLLIYAINHTKLRTIEISKTQRYKMCGNAVTAKMVKGIGTRIRINLDNYLK